MESIFTAYRAHSQLLWRADRFLLCVSAVLHILADAARTTGDCMFHKSDIFRPGGRLDGSYNVIGNGHGDDPFARILEEGASVISSPLGADEISKGGTI